MTTKDKKQLCRGCRDDYYNQPGNSTEGQCWLLDGAKPVLRTKVGTWQPPPYEWLPEKTLHCHQPLGYVWIDKNELRIRKRQTP